MESSSLAFRYRRILETVAEAANRVGRSPESVSLVAITKTVDLARMNEAFALGVRDFGESRVQEALPKMAALPSPSLRWHFIGHLQTNKVKRVVGDFLLIHSVDSFKVAEALSREAEASGAVQPILLQINTSGELSKYGFSPEEAPGITERILRQLPGVRVRGFMTMAPHAEDPEEARPFFRRLRELRDALAAKWPEASFPELSMGMSGDYAVAVEEGATLIRIGTALFGERQPH